MNIFVFTNKTLPTAIREQIVDLYSASFPGQPNRLLANSIRLVLLDDSKVISHAAVIRKTIQHQGQSYKLIGLGGVLTHTDHQKRGFGTQIVRNATEYIRSQKADMAVLFCDEKNMILYRRSGWEVFLNPRITIGKDVSHSRPQNEMTMILYLSSKAKANKEILKEHPIFFGESW